VCFFQFIFIYFYLLNNSKINIVIKIMLDNAGSRGAFPCGTDVITASQGKRLLLLPSVSIPLDSKLSGVISVPASTDSRCL